MNNKEQGARLLLLLVLTLITTLLVPGCSGQATTSESREPYKIGVIASVTGALSGQGTHTRNVALMAEEEINAQGGVNGHPVKMVIYDDQSNMSQTVSLAKKLIEVEQVAAIVGPNTTDGSLAILETITTGETPALVVAGGERIAVPASERKWMFRITPGARSAGEKLVDFMASKGWQRIAVLAVTTEWGQDFEEVLKDLTPKAGIEVVAWERHSPQAKDVTAQLLKIKEAKPDAIFMVSVGASGVIPVQNAKDLELNIPILHCHAVGNQASAKAMGAAGEGVYSASGRIMALDKLPDTEPGKEIVVKFSNNYQQKFNVMADSGAASTYDAFQILFRAMQTAGNNPKAIRDAIETTKGFLGVQGEFNMSPKDHHGLKGEWLRMLQIQNGKFIGL